MDERVAPKKEGESKLRAPSLRLACAPRTDSATSPRAGPPVACPTAAAAAPGSHAVMRPSTPRARAADAADDDDDGGPGVAWRPDGAAVAGRAGRVAGMRDGGHRAVADPAGDRAARVSGRACIMAGAAKKERPAARNKIKSGTG
jgi:hypothetical protein